MLFGTVRSKRFNKESIRTPQKEDEVIIYVSRNPKDVSISYYHHFKLMQNYIGSFEDFIEAFLSDMVLFSPFWGHVLGYWKRKDEFPIIFNTYEEMKKDLLSVVQKTCRFLGKSYTDTEVEGLLDHLSFSKMKENPSVNYEHVITRKRLTEDIKDLKFFRKGEAGGWKKAMSPELSARFDAWTAEKLKDSDYEVDTM
uniref:Sulfotransferase domain-containing protein n=1 Tax=Timema poppense TaxID=170557 RepID=A0A7R9GVY0_TIMPO|nr:unnamed protein product [Timema poppensis]